MRTVKEIKQLLSHDSYDRRDAHGYYKDLMVTLMTYPVDMDVMGLCFGMDHGNADLVSVQHALWFAKYDPIAPYLEFSKMLTLELPRIARLRVTPYTPPMFRMIAPFIDPRDKSTIIRMARDHAQFGKSIGLHDIQQYLDIIGRFTPDYLEEFAIPQYQLIYDATNEIRRCNMSISHWNRPVSDLYGISLTAKMKNLDSARTDIEKSVMDAPELSSAMAHRYATKLANLERDYTATRTALTEMKADAANTKKNISMLQRKVDKLHMELIGLVDTLNDIMGYTMIEVRKDEC